MTKEEGWRVAVGVGGGGGGTVSGGMPHSHSHSLFTLYFLSLSRFGNATCLSPLRALSLSSSLSLILSLFLSLPSSQFSLHKLYVKKIKELLR